MTFGHMKLLSSFVKPGLTPTVRVKFKENFIGTVFWATNYNKKKLNNTVASMYISGGTNRWNSYRIHRLVYLLDI